MQGVLAAFAEIDSAVEAIHDLRKKHFDDITVFTPTPRHEFEEALEPPASQQRTLEHAFCGRSLVHTSGAWRAHLATLAGA